MTETVLITGASGGIGYELAQLFARDHSHLVLVARSKQKLQELAEKLTKEFPIQVTVIDQDLSVPGASEKLYQELASRSLQIDILVNNAGYGLFGEFKNTDLSKELEMIQLNVTALTHLTKLLLPSMIERKSGAILNVASTAAFQPGPLMAVYYATKAYVLSFSEAISEELKGTGVSVTVLCPGPTTTGFQVQAKMESSKLLKTAVIATAKDVAVQGHQGLRRKKRIVVPGCLNKILVQSVRFTPRALMTRIVKRIQSAE